MLGINKRRGRYSREDRRRVVGAWRQSGLSQNRFAKEIGVDASSLSRWKSEFPSDGEPGSALMRVEVVEEPMPLRRRPFDAFRLRLVSGIEIAVPPDFDGAALQRLVATLERSPC
ncbi:MAG: transposase [Dehalococcoidia bacterium]|nr:transposase [Dehalococcoidia bacterium]